MKYLYLFVFVSMGCLVTAQQSYVHQIIFLNEGWYDFANDTLAIPPSVGAYDPVTETYQVFDEIPEADFASDVLVDDVIYVAADNLLITYDKHTLTRLQMVSVPGIRELAIWEDQLLVTRGDYLVFFDSYFQVYDKHTLELLYELTTDDGPAYASEGIVIRDNTAYVAINNGFVFGEEVGLIGVVDLQTQTYVDEIDLGPSGKNPENIMLGVEKIYTLNNKDFSSSSISVVDPVSMDVTTHDLVAANSGCGTSALADEKIYFMEYGVDKLARFDVESAQVIDTLAETGAYYGLVDDQINGRLIGTLTDFVSQGTAYLLSYDGQVMQSFDVGVSPGSIALDVRMATGVHEAGEEVHVYAFPNPVTDVLWIEAEEQIQKVTLSTVAGESVYSRKVDHTLATIPVGTLVPGLYIAQVEFASGIQKMMKVLRQ